VEGEER
jgi:hypothetical protein